MPGAVFPAERGLRARGPKPARQDFRRPNRASQVCKDSPLKGDGFEISVPQCLATADGGHLHSGLTGSSSPRKQLYPFVEADNHSDDSAALTSNDPNPTEA